MRILNWTVIQKEIESSAAFNMTLLRAIDPRLITHRPRDPEKARLMKELGIETEISDIVKKPKTKLCKGARNIVPISWKETEQ
jgi:hypothetical protein